MQASNLPRVLVTGANKGIGFGIVELALKHAQSGRGPHYHFLVGSRDVQNGLEAVRILKTQFPAASLEVLQVDIASDESIALVAEFLKQQGGVDILVNNAGMAFKGSKIDSEVVNSTMGTNFFGTRKLTETLLEQGLIRPHGKIVMVSSIMGKFWNLAQVNPQAYATLNRYKKDLTMAEFDQVLGKYMTEMMDENKRKNWIPNVYGSSKLFLSIYAHLLSRSAGVQGQAVQVYSCHPGWVQTDMTKGQAAPLSIEQGAETPYFLMTFRDKVDPAVQGEFFDNKLVTPLN